MNPRMFEFDEEDRCPECDHVHNGKEVAAAKRLGLYRCTRYRVERSYEPPADFDNIHDAVMYARASDPTKGEVIYYGIDTVGENE